MKNLNVLTGLNSTGKSSVIQSLVLLHQSLLENSLSMKSLVLNGDFISLGTPSDLIDKLYGNKELSISLETKGNVKIDWVFKSNGKSLVCENQNSEICRVDDEFFALLTELHYISADRLGPRETYQTNWPDKFSSVGPRGERTLWFIQQNENYEISETLKCKDTPQPQLPRQIEAWMKIFFPGSSFEIQPIQGTNLASFGVRTSDMTNFHRPQNVGFGFSYTLPIVTACLGAKKGQVVLVENPEAHLHPAAQSRMGEFLALVADSGVQVIIETHSDHVINGIRKAVKSHNIDRKDVAINYFSHRNEMISVDEKAGSNKDTEQHIVIPVYENGEIRDWPKGFFDQFDDDLGFLVEW